MFLFQSFLFKVLDCLISSYGDLDGFCVIEINYTRKKNLRKKKKILYHCLIILIPIGILFLPVWVLSHVLLYLTLVLVSVWVVRSWLYWTSTAFAAADGPAWSSFSCCFSVSPSALPSGASVVLPRYLQAALGRSCPLLP